MKIKLAIALALATSTFAQSPSLSANATNFGTGSPMRQFLPPDSPPMVWVFVYDTNPKDSGFSVSITYRTADGAQHSETQMVKRTGTTTLVAFPIDAVSMDANPIVYPFAFTGASFPAN